MVKQYSQLYVSTDANCNCGDNTDDNNGVNIALATIMVIAIIGLVTSIVINVFVIVKLKQARCVVTSILSIQLQLTICCRYDVNQSGIKYSDVKQSVSRNHTIKDSEPSDPEYEAITTDHKPDYNVKMDADPAYATTVASQCLMSAEGTTVLLMFSLYVANCNQLAKQFIVQLTKLYNKMQLLCNHAGH